MAAMCGNCRDLSKDKSVLENLECNCRICRERSAARQAALSVVNMASK